MAKRKTNFQPTKYLSELLLACVIFLVTLSVTHNLVRLRSLTLDTNNLQEYQAASEVVPRSQLAVPTKIIVPDLINTLIDPSIIANNKYMISPNHASYLMTSARPGESGNIIIYGHNKREILGQLRSLHQNDVITLILSDNSSRSYKVLETIQVSPNKTELLRPTSIETLTLYTCSGFLDSQRFVVRASPLLE